MMRSWLSVLGATVVVAACESEGSLPVVADDAASPLSDAGSPLPMLDAGLTDAGATVDAADDAGPVLDAAGDQDAAELDAMLPPPDADASTDAGVEDAGSVALCGPPGTTIGDFRDAYPDSWEALLPSNAASLPSFLPPGDCGGSLPRHLIIGDSISLCYTPHLRRNLEGVYEVHRVPHNGASTEQGLASIETYLEAGPWDLITVNWGLHDLIHTKRMTAMGVVRVNRTEVSVYEMRLRTLVRRLQQSGARVVWINTTPTTLLERYEPEDVPIYNAAAARAMQAREVSVIDLVESEHRTRELVFQADGLHFDRETCVDFGAIIAAELEELTP